MSISSRGGIKSVAIVSLLRCSSHIAKGNKFCRMLGFPIRLFYRLFSRNLMHVEIWDTTQIGRGKNTLLIYLAA